MDAVEQTILHLRAGIPDTQVGARVPSPRPVRFLLCRRLGGTFTWPVVDAPMIGIEAWEGSDAKAHDLCQQARALIWSLRGRTFADGTPVYRVQEVAGPSSLPDPDSDQPRYVATFVLSHRHQMEVA